MRTLLEQPEAVAPPRRGTVGFQVRDVTRSYDIDVRDVASGTPAYAVAQTVAARMDLPTNVPWALRSDRTGAWMPDDAPIEEALDADSQTTYTLTPKAHLGGHDA